MSNSNNHIKEQDSSARNRQIENSIAKEVARLKREGEQLYKSIKVKKKLFILLPIVTGILACVCLGLCQPYGYTDMGILGIAIVLFVVTFALGFYAYYWWNHKLGLDPAYSTVDDFSKAHIRSGMYEHTIGVQKEILQQYKEFLSEYHASNDRIQDIGKLYIWKYDKYLYITDSNSQHVDRLIGKYINSSYDISSICDDEGNYDINCFRLPIKNIKYYAKEGDVQYTTQVSGGGGGGVPPNP